MAKEHPQEETPDHHLPKMTKDKPSVPYRALCTCFSIFLLLAGVTALTLWLVYRPHKPQFTIVGAAVYSLNVTSPPLISTTMQFTLVTRNPNRRVSIYYDRLSAFVAYKNQAITPQVTLPPLVHEHRSTVAVSPVLGGGEVPVAVEVVNGLMMDEVYGVVALRVVVTGRLRWKAGAIRTGHYGIYVKCDVLVGLKKGFVGQVPLLGNPACKVDI
ncbi:protein YLS9 [Pyrus ussuriensis x Pyrus communis]|uniref:Protein YLS9 n=1 Tax=Pyrus ussuriensis x Pyrus communis TaxID=2448454 RepID=A0A5N5EYM3_9ROSA|nr:protein YLS9 [Pyrus ussuriensis x Pyrus communis]